MTAAATLNGQYSLSSPPPGAYFDIDEVKGDHGQKSYGNRPLLTWNETEEGVSGAIAFYGHEGVALIINGTSVRVTAQGIARRVTEQGVKEGWSDEKINETIAQKQLEYRPGKRQAGQSTAVSRAQAAARRAAGKIDGDAMSEAMEKIAAMSPEERAALAASMGITKSFELQDEEEEVTA